MIRPRSLFLLLAPALACAADSPFQKLFFEPNLGQAGSQTDHSIRYVAHAAGANIAWTRDGLLLQLHGDDSAPVHLRLSGASAAARFEPLGESADRSDYFIGRDQSKWVRDVRHYSRLAWRGVYPGIDMIFYGDGNRLEYDFVLAPGADPNRLRMTVDPSAQLALSGGDITVRRRRAIVRTAAAGGLSGRSTAEQAKHRGRLPD